MGQGKKRLSFSNISTVVLFLFVLSVVFVPEVKAWVIGNLMKVGLFSANVPGSAKEGEKLTILAAPQEAIFLDGHGQQLRLSSLRGKVVFINFWATWCPPCIAEMPSIDALRKKIIEKEVVFLMIDVDGKQAESTAFMKGKGFDLPVYTTAGNISVDYFEGSMPTTVILDSLGNMVFKHVGAANYASPKMMDFINKL